jgi:hypothetical protein
MRHEFPRLNHSKDEGCADAAPVALRSANVRDLYILGNTACQACGKRFDGIERAPNADAPGQRWSAAKREVGTLGQPHPIPSIYFQIS